jgi:hypothetical protein
MSGENSAVHEWFKTLGFANLEDMIRDGYGLEPEEVGIAVRWLELNPPNEPQSGSRLPRPESR